MNIFRSAAWVWVSGWVLLASPLWSQETEAAAAWRYQGQVRLAPPRELAGQVSGFLRHAVPDLQPDMMLFGMLGAYGYPQFPGVSEQEEVTVFCWEGEGKTALLLLLRAREDSLAVAGLKRGGWLDRTLGEYVLLSRSAPLLEHFGQVEPLLALRQGERQWAVELRWSHEEVLRQAAAISESLVLQQEDQVFAEGLRRWFLERLGEVQELRLGLDFKGETLVGLLRFSYVPGTPEQAFFAAPLPERVSAADWLSAEGQMVGGIGRFHAEALRQWMAARIPSAVEAFVQNPALREPLRASLMDALRLDFGDGTGAMTLNLSSLGGPPKMHAVEGGAFDAASLDAYADCLEGFYESFDACWHDWMQKYSPMPMTMHNKVLRGVAQVQGAPVHQIVQTLSLPQVDEDTGTALLKDGVPLEVVHTTHDTYFTVAAGQRLTADSLETIEALAAIVAKGERVPQALSESLVLGEREMLAVFIDIGLLYGQIAAMSADTGTPAAEVSAALGVLAQSLKGHRVSMRLMGSEDGSATFALEVPAQTVSAGVKAMRALQAKPRQGVLEPPPALLQAGEPESPPPAAP